jgi:hypothetical protein
MLAELLRESAIRFLRLTRANEADQTRYAGTQSRRRPNVLCFVCVCVFVFCFFGFFFVKKNYPNFSEQKNSTKHLKSAAGNGFTAL